MRSKSSSAVFGAAGSAMFCLDPPFLSPQTGIIHARFPGVNLNRCGSKAVMVDRPGNGGPPAIRSFRCEVDFTLD
jgi:hypothetical protein